MDARTLLGDGDADDEVRRLAEPLRSAVRSNVRDQEVHLAMGGDGAAVVATGCCIYHVTVTRAAPRVRRAEYAEVALVDGRVAGGRAELMIRLADGTSMLVHAPIEQGEQAMQAATVLNLLAVEARRHVSPGRGLRAAPRPAARPRRPDPRIAGLRPRR